MRHQRELKTTASRLSKGNGATAKRGMRHLNYVGGIKIDDYRLFTDRFGCPMPCAAITPLSYAK